MRPHSTLLALLALLAPAACSPPVLATVAALALVPCSSPAAAAWVRYQGPWSCAPACPCAPDSVTCVVAGSGPACWVRGVAGLPGAAAEQAWFSDSTLGDDSNDCLAPGASATGPGGHGACASLLEPIRRVGIAQIALPTVLTLAGSYAGFSGTIQTSPNSTGFLTVLGTRTYAGADGGALFSGTLAAYTSWNGSASQEGVATVGPAVDGGPTFDPSAWSGAGFVLEDDSQCDSSGCLAVVIGPEVDAGTFATPGGVLLDNPFALAEPAAGDSVRIAALTPVGTSPGATIAVGGGTFIGQNLSIGSGPHSIAVQAESGPNNGFECVACGIDGIDVNAPSWFFPLGVDFTRDTPHVYGKLAGGLTDIFANLEVRGGGMVELSGNNIVTLTLQTGAVDGPGVILLDNGPVAFLGGAGLLVSAGAVTRVESPLWCHTTASGSPCGTAGTGSAILYDSGFAPVIVGGPPAVPWLIGGASSSSLPFVNEGALSAITVNQ